MQGPPGTGKTHTIANLICHAMATGQRVSVVSRGEAALAVLKGQLPKEVQPLAIAVLSNEREGLRQIESAIREIQGVVEGTQPQNRPATITGLEKELEGLRKRIGEIDHELDAIALAHLTKLGPRSETPAELAQRVVAEREAFRWFTDRPLRFVSETSLEEKDVAALFDARVRCGELIDHLNADLPSPLDLPDANTIAHWHDDLIAAAEHEQAAGQGPVRNVRIAPRTSRRRGAWRRRWMIWSARIKPYRALDGSTHFAALSSRANRMLGATGCANVSPSGLQSMPKGRSSCDARRNCRTAW